MLTPLIPYLLQTGIKGSSKALPKPVTTYVSNTWWVDMCCHSQQVTKSKQTIQCSFHMAVCCMAVLEADINHDKLHPLQIDCTMGSPWSTTILHSREDAIISTPDTLKCFQRHTIYLHFPLFPHTEITLVAGILSADRHLPPCYTQSTSWVFFLTSPR